MSHGFHPSHSDTHAQPSPPGDSTDPMRLFAETMSEQRQIIASQGRQALEVADKLSDAVVAVVEVTKIQAEAVKALQKANEAYAKGETNRTQQALTQQTVDLLKRLVFGVVGLILLAVATGVLGLVITKAG